MPCLHGDGLAPAGKRGLILSAMTHWNYANNWGLRDGRLTDRYGVLKQRCAGEMIASLERFMPDLGDRVELSITATPYTIQRRTSNAEGAIMGWSYDRRKAFRRIGVLRVRRAVLTPVPNLLMAGHWAFSPGGSPVAVLTGRLAASRILESG